MKIGDLALINEPERAYDQFVLQLQRLEASLPPKPLVEKFSKRYYVIGDLHGDHNTLSRILERIGEVSRDESIIALGDYGDRGDKQVEVWITVAKLRLVLGDAFLPLRGNHEPDSYAIPYPHDIREKLIVMYGYEKGEKAYGELFSVFQRLPLVAIGQSIVALHGGFPVNVFDLRDEVKLRQNMYEVLWNDPFDGKGFEESPRGIGHLFGKDISQAWLNALGKKFLVRGHEPCEGYKVDHDGLVYTVFSRKGYPYYNMRAAFAIVEGDYISFETV